MLAGGVGVPTDGADWQVEPKWDGVRAIATIGSGAPTSTGLRLAGRQGNDITAAYPELMPMADAAGGKHLVLDGEIVAFDGTGRPSFELLQRRMHVRNPSAALLTAVPVVFVAFDLLWLDGILLVDLPQKRRRLALEALALSGPTWQTSPVLPAAPGPALLAACRAIGLEGYMAKRADAPYWPGRRSNAWSKIKALGRSEFVVGGWKPGEGRRSGTIGSLALGAYDQPGGRFLYVGQAGSGLSDELIKLLSSAFPRIGRSTSPFDVPTPKGLRFVEPALVVDVVFNSMTSAGQLRQPAIKGLRTDVAATQVVLDR